MQESLVTQEYKPEDILNAVHYNKGILWDKIAAFRERGSKRRSWARSTRPSISVRGGDFL